MIDDDIYADPFLAIEFAITELEDDCHSFLWAWQHGDYSSEFKRFVEKKNAELAGMA